MGENLAMINNKIYQNSAKGKDSLTSKNYDNIEKNEIPQINFEKFSSPNMKIGDCLNIPNNIMSTPKQQVSPFLGSNQQFPKPVISQRKTTGDKNKGKMISTEKRVQLQQKSPIKSNSKIVSENVGFFGNLTEEDIIEENQSKHSEDSNDDDNKSIAARTRSKKKNEDEIYDDHSRMAEELIPMDHNLNMSKDQQAQQRLYRKIIKPDAHQQNSLEKKQDPISQGENSSSKNSHCFYNVISSANKFLPCGILAPPMVNEPSKPSNGLCNISPLKSPLKAPKSPTRS